VRYLGGKERIATTISEFLLSQKGDRTIYVEPFIGGGSVYSRVSKHFTRSYGSDTHTDLILMWQALQGGWVPPTSLDSNEYRFLKDSEPSALRAFAGFGCSFGGKWFGGYARSGDRNYALNAHNSVMKKSAGMTGTISCRDYRDYRPSARSLVYCDPPYADTTGYTGVDAFDSDEFWSTMRAWRDAGALVFVSEDKAPDDWTSVLNIERRRDLSDNDRRVVEGLFA
jgi:DNA adenine methylase